MAGAFFCPLTEKSDSGEASVNFSTDIDYEWQDRSRQRAEEAAGANRKQAVRYRTAGPSFRNPSYPCHAAAGRNDHPRPDTQQHGFSCLRQGGQRAFSNYSRQHRRRRTDTQGCAGPFHHWEMARCFKAICSTRGSYSGGIPCRAERSPITTARGFPITR